MENVVKIADIKFKKKDIGKIMDKTVYVVHCVDTEGPLYDFFNNMSYNDTWQKIDNMLDKITSVEFRDNYSDSFRNGWIYNWFCMDHVGITGLNPRRRSLGFHTIYDHYVEYNNVHNINCDLIQWHYHPLSIVKDAHRCGSTFINSSNIFMILARKIIDRNWFPTVYRPGFHMERPDLNWFLEMWIPFDYGNQSVKTNSTVSLWGDGRFGDWRYAPLEWFPYHPSIYNYQKKGFCKRYITRCLNMNARFRMLTIYDVRDSFKYAQKNGCSLLSFVNHDYRDMENEIDKVWNMINKVSNDFKDVKFKIVNAIQGLRNVGNIKKCSPPNFKINFNKNNKSFVLKVKAINSIFGVQPFLAIKTKTQDYIWENFDFQTNNNWSYTFDFDTLSIDAIEKIGIASNNIYGIAEVIVLDVETNDIKRVVLNDN
jgi:hypothetical protein